MLLEIKPEYRALLEKDQRCCTDIPASTPAHIRARIIAGSIAHCEKRSITSAESRAYELSAAAHATSRHATKPVDVDTLFDFGSNYVIAELNRRCGLL